MKMASAFANFGHDVVVIAKKGKNCAIGIELFEYYGVKMNFKIVRGTYPNIKFGWIIWGLLKLRIVRRIKPDLVFARDSFGALLSALVGFDVFFEVHSAPHGRDKIIFKFLFLLKRIKKIVTISKALSDYLSKKYKIPDGKIIVARDAVDQSWLNRSVDRLGGRDELGYHKSDFIVGYSGSLYKGRGIELIIEVAKRQPLSKFLVIGGPDIERKRFVILAKNLGLNNLQFIEYIQTSLLPKYLYSCDILVMPYQPNFKTADNGPDTSKFMSPLKMFEYMATGKPIIASNLEVLREVLVNEKNSLLVEPDNTSQWCDAIERLKSDSPLTRNLGLNARADVRKFTWSKRSNSILNE